MKIPDLQIFKCKYIVVLILLRNYSIKCEFDLAVLTCVIQRDVEGCGFFLWLDSPNDGEELVSTVRRVQLLERNLLQLRSKLDVVERKVNVLGNGSYSFFANDFGYAMKIGLVLVMFVLIIYSINVYNCMCSRNGIFINPTICL